MTVIEHVLGGVMYKFERLRVYRGAVEYWDLCCSLADALPPEERYELGRQLRRAASSVPLNLAEGSTGTSNREQARFVAISTRSLLETVACLDLLHRRGHVGQAEHRSAYTRSQILFRQLQAYRLAILARSS